MGFLFITACDSGKIVYVSDSVLPVLGHTQIDWLGHSLVEFLHPDDVEKVQEQLCPSEVSAQTRILDLKSKGNGDFRGEWGNGISGIRGSGTYPLTLAKGATQWFI